MADEEAKQKGWVAPRKVTQAPPPPSKLAVGRQVPAPSSDFAHWASKAGSPDWGYWSNLAVVDVYDACCLSFGVDPSGARRLHDASERLAPIERRTQIAATHLRRGLPAYMTEADKFHQGEPTGVNLSEFRTWAESLPAPFTFPVGFPMATKPELAAPMASAQTLDKPVDERERETLLCIIGALAKAQNLDLGQPYKAGEAVTRLDEELALHARTIGDKLKLVPAAMDARKTRKKI